MMPNNILDIQLILMDVDGVLTNGKIVYTSNGEELKEFNVQDGMGITLARMAGLKTGIITGRHSPMVAKRAKELKFDVISQGHFNKLPEYEKIKKELNMDDSQIAYIGDDLLDIPILKRVGFSIAVANARDEVKAVCNDVTIAAGGNGAGSDAFIKISINTTDERWLFLFFGSSMLSLSTDVHALKKAAKNKALKMNLKCNANSFSVIQT
jgi:3-deoxy-D-manno-octulosonate 8-phosphate phosphatase (KDO 8-P phosphatase)